MGMVKHWFVIVAFAFSFVAAYGQSIEDASSGKHSLQALGSDFSLQIPIEQIKDARLVLFNFEAAQGLGLDLPTDPKELEKVILEKFAVFVAKEGATTDRTMMATYYMDSGKKGPGEALGDGRALWSGELATTKSDGSTSYVDFVLKGIGQTPMAWTNHKEAGHKDGLQAMQEGVHSFIVSQANFRNNLDSTVDLAVIEIPTEKKNKYTGEMEKAAITLRVGNQTRIAHFAYFADNKEQFRKMADYVVRRDLGLPINHTVTAVDVNKYLESFTKNLAVEGARYLDLDAVHGSPTLGNRTTNGSTIDMGTFRYLDAHHGEYKYLFQRLSFDQQNGLLKQYIRNISSYMQNNHYFADEIHSEMALYRVYDVTLSNELTKVWLERLGLSAAQIEKISAKDKRYFYESIWNLKHAKGKSQVNLSSQNILPAAFDVREIFPELARLAMTTSTQEQINKVFLTSRPWGTLTKEDIAIKSNRNFIQNLFPSLADMSTYANYILAVINSTKTILNSLAVKIDEIPMIERRARHIIAGKEREVPQSDSFFKGEAEILKSIQDKETAKFDFAQESRKALGMASMLVDNSSERSVKSGTYLAIKANQSQPSGIVSGLTCNKVLLEVAL